MAARRDREASLWGRVPARAPGWLWALGCLSVTFSASLAQADWVGDGLARLGGLFQRSIADGHYGTALLLTFAAGLLTSLTPCVYPMITITVSVFGARQSKSWVEGAGLSAMYVLGIVALFVPLGVSAGLSGGLFGDWLNSPLVIGAIVLVMVVLSIAMLGAFELNLPPSLQNRLASVGGVGPAGAFLLGLVGALLAAPCVGPPLLALLGYIGSRGDAAFGALAMLAYALGLGVLFFLVGTFSVSLPKSGRWLEWSKSLFAAVMLALALTFARALLPIQLPAASPTWLMVSLMLVAAGVLFGAVHLRYQGTLGERLRKTGALLALVLGLAATGFWLQGAPVAAGGERVTWLHEFEDAKTLAEQEGRPLLVDFTASWCGACGELDKHTLHEPRVVAALLAQRVVPVKVDLSPGAITDDRRALLARYQTRGGLPLVVLHDARGKEVARITQFVDAEQFLAFLSQLPH